MTRDELIAALERAEGPSRELDYWCWWRSTDVLRHDDPEPDDVAEDIRRDIMPRYTASIDAALSLVPDGWHWAVSWGGVHLWRHFEDYPIPGTGIIVQHKTPAIALCIAALKARA